VKSGAREELIMSFPMEMKAFDPASGKELWNCAGLNPLVYAFPDDRRRDLSSPREVTTETPSPFAPGEPPTPPESHRLWQEVRHNGGIGTGVIKDGYYYYHNSGGARLLPGDEDRQNDLGRTPPPVLANPGARSSAPATGSMR